MARSASCSFRGVRPFLSDKYDITRNINATGSYPITTTNAFDVERYMRCQLMISRDEPFEYVEFSEEDLSPGREMEK